MDPIIIIAPDGTEVEFPPGTPDSVIEAAMKAEYGGAESADLYGDPSIMGAIEAAPAQEAYRGQSGNPIDITDWDAASLVQLPQGAWVVHRKYEDGQPFQLAATPEAGAGSLAAENLGNVAVNPPQRWDQDVVRSGMTGAIEGITILAGLPGTVQEAVSNLTGMPRGYGAPGGRVFASGADLDALTQNVIGDYYQPQTTAGEYARMIGQNLPSAVVPGGPALRAASVVVPAVASETAGQLTEGASAEPFARLAGGLLGGGAVAGVSAARGGVGRVIQNATEGVTPQQLQLAEALQGRAAQVGVPLTNAEALQQVTGGATGLSRVQRVVEGANTRLAPMMAERPSRTTSAIGRVLEQIAPETQGSQVATRAQEGANKVLTTLRQRVNESAQPAYERLAGQTLTPEDFAQLSQNPSYMAAQSEVMGNPELAAMLSGAPQDISTVNRVVTQLDQMAENARPGVANPMGNNTIASQRTQAAALARQLAEGASPDFRFARETVRTGNEAFVDPVKAGPLGRIANQNEVMPGLQGQTNALFPSAPFEGQAQETAQALRLLNEVDPSVPPSLVRQHLAQQAAEATQGLQSGENAFGGANFIARTMGNPAQRQTLLGAVDVAAPQASRDVRDLAEVLAATGRREGSGSQTAFSGSLQQDLRGGNLMQGLMQTVTDPLGTPKRLSTSVDDMFARRNAETLAEALAGDPRAFSELVTRAGRQPRGMTRLRLLASALGSQQGNE